MTILRWTITAVTSASLIFTAATSPGQFPNVAQATMPVLALALENPKSNKHE